MLAITSAIIGYFVGERRGISKGAHIGAGLAASNLDNEILFLFMLEDHFSEGIPDIEIIKDTMIDRIELYTPSKVFLSAPPYSQTGGLSFDQETIDAAIERLKDSKRKNPKRDAEQGGGGKRDK